MPDEQEDRPQYTRYRARRRLLGERGERAPTPGAGRTPGASRAPGASRTPGAAGMPGAARARILPARAQARWRGFAAGGWRRWTRPKRLLTTLLAILVGWVLLSVALFLISSHFERTAPPSDVASVLDPGGFPLTSSNNILVLGSDRREKGSKEPGAETSGPGRSDTILLIRTGGGHSARLSIPRDTIVEIPGHGREKINAAHEFGGPALSISVIEHWLGIPINHLVEVNFENFPQLINSMGGVTYSGGCLISELSGGTRNGGYTLRLSAGTHHLDGKEALALARTRKNLCAPSQTDIQREEHQQALFEDMRKRLLSPSSFLRLPLIAWNAPPAIISDMGGPQLLALFAAIATSGTPPTQVLAPTGAETLPSGEEGLTVSEAAKQAAVARFMSG